MRELRYRWLHSCIRIINRVRHHFVTCTQGHKRPRPLYIYVPYLLSTIELKQYYHEPDFQDKLTDIAIHASIEIEKEINLEVDTLSDESVSLYAETDTTDADDISEAHFVAFCTEAMEGCDAVYQLLEKLIQRMEDLLSNDPLLPLLQFETTRDNKGQILNHDQFSTFLSSTKNDAQVRICYHIHIYLHVCIYSF